MKKLFIVGFAFLVIFTSLLVWSVITLLTGFVQTYAELITTRAIMGVS